MIARQIQFLPAHPGVGSLVNRESQMKHVVSSWQVLCRQAQRLGPYLLVEAVMPGGSLLALLLYLYRARKGV